jgi:hypothetical protein
VTGWVVHVEVTPNAAPERAEPSRYDVGPLEAPTDELVDLHGSVAGDERGWRATVTVDAHSADDALGAGGHLLSIAFKVGLPTEPVTRLEVVREDIRDAELERPQLPELVSGTEAAEILGVTRQRVHQLAAAHPDFPKPAYRLGVGSLWFRSGIEGFAQRWQRRPGRPPSAAS